MMNGQQQSYQPAPQSGGYSPNHYQQQQQQPQGGFAGFKLGGAAPPPPGPGQQQRRPGAKKWTVAQLRASDAIIPLQSGTNQFASQRGMTGFGQPRNTTTPVFGGMEIPRDPEDTVIPLQYGTNQFASQRGMTGFGQPRDVTGKHLHSLVDEDYIPDQQQQQPQWQ